MAQEPETAVAFLPAARAQAPPDGSFVVVIRTREEFLHWLATPVPGLEWLQIEGLLGDPEVWAVAAQGSSQLPLDVVVDDPAAEFASLYRLVDVRIVRPVRVTMPAMPGMLKALRLAASLQIPVRLLPEQPSAAALAELAAAADFYLHDAAVDAPVEPFHSMLTALHGAGGETLWRILEHDPALFERSAIDGRATLPKEFVETHLGNLVANGAECANCPWQEGCAGYFKWPDPAYDCAGVKELFATLETAAAEIERDLASAEAVTS